MTTTEDRSIYCSDCGSEVFAWYEDGDPLCWCRDNFPKNTTTTESSADADA
jgi:hypothetical protein